MAHVFISIPFSTEFEQVSAVIRQAAAERLLTSYRTDQEHMAQPIDEVIRRSIRESRLVVADVTGNNANVLYEIGIAQALGKPLILLSQDARAKATFNIRNLRILNYDLGELGSLHERLKLALSETTSPNETLRAMLVPGSLGHPTRESRFVVAASPLSFRRAVGRSGGYKKLRRTSSDYVGVRGILQAFGLLYGFETLPDNLDPEDCQDAVIQEDMNIYCIASPKANRWTRVLLEEYCRSWVPHIEFRADPASRDLNNVRVSIFNDGALLSPPGWEVNVKGDRYARDFGVIVRGPNPFHKNSLAAIVAGRSSLATEAACTGFTDPDAISRIRARLQGLRIDLEDHTQPFWALLSMKRALADEREEALKESLEVHQVDTFRLR